MKPPKIFENLWQLPRSGSSFHRCVDISSEHRTKSIPPEPHHFVADLDATFMQQILDIAK